jgi:hypothetical protein
VDLHHLLLAGLPAHPCKNPPDDFDFAEHPLLVDASSVDNHLNNNSVPRSEAK